MPKTLAEKVYDAHVVRSAAGEPDLLYIDLHLVHEVTSPQAFDGLRLAGRRVRPWLAVSSDGVTQSSLAFPRSGMRVLLCGTA